MTDADPLALEVDPYHTLSAPDRDHLLAAAILNATRDTLPAGATVAEAVGRITGEHPSKTGLMAALERLVDAGYVERVDGEPNGRSRGVRVTDEGYRVLGRGAERLDAAATVGAEQ